MIGPICSSHETVAIAGPSWTEEARVRQAFAYFTAQGWPPHQAAGIVANLQAESRLVECAFGDGGLAYGIAQWRGARQRDFAKWAGRPIQGSSFEQQLGFVQHELVQEAALLQAAKNAREAGRAVSQSYERPADEDGAKARRRGRLAEELLAALGVSPRKMA